MKNDYVTINGRLEHRIIMEIYIGRKLNKEEVVHHKNGVKYDNRIENLEVMTISQHSKYHYLNRNHVFGGVRNKTSFRYGDTRGSKNRKAKLNEDKVIFIRNNKHSYSTKEFCAMFGVAERTVRDVKSNKYWKHIL